MTLYCRQLEGLIEGSMRVLVLFVRVVILKVGGDIRAV
jgi:hypothetical protein